MLSSLGMYVDPWFWRGAGKCAFSCCSQESDGRGEGADLPGRGLGDLLLHVSIGTHLPGLPLETSAYSWNKNILCVSILLAWTCWDGLWLKYLVRSQNDSVSLCHVAGLTLPCCCYRWSFYRLLRSWSSFPAACWVGLAFLRLCGRPGWVLLCHPDSPKYRPAAMARENRHF